MTSQPQPRIARKKDFVTVFAVLLFALIFVFEAFFIVYLPMKLNTMQGMDEEIAKQIMVETQDTLRAKLRGVDDDASPDIKGEKGIAIDVLDDYAYYDRQNRDTLSLDQTRRINADIEKIERMYAAWKKGECFSADLSIDGSICLRKKMNTLFGTEYKLVPSERVKKPKVEKKDQKPIGI